MAIIIREFLGSEILAHGKGIPAKELSEALHSVTTASEDSLMVDIEGIHVGPTRNFTWYTEKALRGSVHSWTNPYDRPLILHHNEKDGRIVGRVRGAKYTDINTRSKTGALIFKCDVSDDEAKKGVLDGRYATVSIGVIANDVKCSICGHSISDYGECEHERGVEYDGETCYWIIDDMEAKELSYVIVPSDIYAHNIKIYKPHEKTELHTKEGVINVTEAVNNSNVTIDEVTESNEITEETVKKADEAVAEQESKEQSATDEAAGEEQNEAKEPETKEQEEAQEHEEEKAEAELKVVELEATIDALKDTIEVLSKTIKEKELQCSKEKELRKAAENELVCTNAQLKEFAVERILDLREQLGRKSVSIKESLMERSSISLMDTVSDLKEELAEKFDVQQKVVDSVAEITPVTAESLIEEEKDAVTTEKKSGVDVKESKESSNNDYETSLNSFMKYYNL